MTAAEVREAADLGDPYGLLFDYRRRGHRVELLGRGTVEGRDAYELEVTLPGGAVRQVWLDAETALELEVDATRVVAGRERRVQTFYRDWRTFGGLRVPSRQETRTEGSPELHALTVDSVRVNPSLDDARFARPDPS
jgi:hypothetical protein